MVVRVVVCPTILASHQTGEEEEEDGKDFPEHHFTKEKKLWSFRIYKTRK